MRRPDAADVLRRCQVPPDEIRRVLTADDPAAVHMILELHRERLEEELEAWLTEEDGARLLER